MSILSHQLQDKQISVMASAFEAALFQQTSTTKQISEILKGTIVENENIEASNNQSKSQENLNQVMIDSLSQYFINDITNNKQVNGLLGFVKQFIRSEEFKFFMKLPDETKQNIVKQVFESLGLLEVILQFKQDSTLQQVSNIVDEVNMQSPKTISQICREFDEKTKTIFHH